MSKAEERAKERYQLEPTNIDTREKYCAYVEGYCQAEKDLKLTWEDIRDICSIQYIVLNEYNDYDEPSNSILYQEVLKRFNEHRQKK